MTQEEPQASEADEAGEQHEVHECQPGQRDLEGEQPHRLFAHNGSKQDLQLATIDHACEVFFEHVVAPALEQPPGVVRLRALCSNWIDYARRRTFPGGCFFFSVSAEFDSRPGRVRDVIAQTRSSWIDLLATTIEQSQEGGELQTDIDPGQLAFELDAVGMAANLDAQLFDVSESYDRAGSAHRSLLERATRGPTRMHDEPAEAT